MENRATRRANRSRNTHTISKAKMRIGYLFVAVMFMLPLLFGGLLVWASNKMYPTEQKEASASTSGTSSEPATDVDVANMHDSGIRRVLAGQLKPGDTIVMKDGSTHVIKSIDVKAGTEDAAVAADDAAPSDSSSIPSNDDEWILAPDNILPPLANGDPAPLPVAHSSQDPGFHPLDVQKREVNGGKIILTGVNAVTGKTEVLIGKMGRDNIYSLGNPNGKLKTGTIGNVRTGDYVVTRNPQTGKNEFKRVAQTFQHLVHETITATFADAKTHKIVDTLTATPEHPFFVPGKGTVPLGQLGIGTEVVTRAGPPLIVASLVKHSYPKGVPVYNFEVEGDHTYFVGKANGGVWVHNDCWSIARAFRSRLGGEVWKLTPKFGNYIDRAREPVFGTIDKEFGGIESWSEHAVHVKDGMVRDPMMTGNNNPIPMEEWQTFWNNFGDHNFGPVR